MFRLDNTEKTIQITDSKMITHFRDYIDNDPELRNQFFKTVLRTLEERGDFHDQYGWPEVQPECLIVNIPISLYPSR